MLRTLLCAVFALLLVVGGLLAAEIKGKIKSIDADKMTVTVTDEDGKDHVLNVEKDAKLVSPGGKDLKDGLKAKQFKEGAAVVVTCEKKDGKECATEIKL